MGNSISSVAWVIGFILLIGLWGTVLLTTLIPFVSSSGILVDTTVDLSIVSVPLMALNLFYFGISICFLAVFAIFFDKVKKRQLNERSESERTRAIMHNKKLLQIKGNDDLVSIIIPARNEETVIKESIRRCLQQTHKNIEVIIICHNCSDRTYEESQVQDERVKAFGYRTEASGKGVALNYGVEMSKGKYILILDSDGILSDNFIEDALPMFSTRENCAAVQGRYMPSNRNYNFITRMLALEGDIWSAPYNTFRDVLDGRVGLGGTGYIIRRDTLNVVGGFKNHLVDDFELTYRLLRKKFRIAYAPLSINYDEKPPTLDLMLKQRARWTRGFLNLLRDRIAEPQDIIGNLYWIAPIVTFASLGLLVLAGYAAVYDVFYGYYPYKYSYISIEAWFALNATMILLSTFALVKQYGAEGLKYAIWLPFYVPFSVYYFVTALKALGVKSWASTKTTHGFRTTSNEKEKVNEKRAS